MTIKPKSVPAAQRVEDEVVLINPVEARVLECVEEPAVAAPSFIAQNATQRQVRTAGRQSIIVLEAPAELPASVPAYFKVQSPVAKPATMSVDSTINNCEIIQRKWKVNPGLAGFGIMWNTFMFFWNFIAISNGIWIMFLFATLHNMIGLFLIYQVLCGFYNSTFVTITSDNVQVEVRQLHWRKQRPKCVPMESIQEVCCKRCVVHRGENSTSITFEVQFIKNGSRQVLLSNLQYLEEALFIEQEIEKFLVLSVENGNKSTSTERRAENHDTSAASTELEGVGAC